MGRTTGLGFLGWRFSYVGYNVYFWVNIFAENQSVDILRHYHLIYLFMVYIQFYSFPVLVPDS